MLLIPKRTLIDDGVKWGIYLWRLPNGKYIQDSDHNHLVVGPVENGNPRAIENLTRAAANLGITDGGPFFLSGFRKISDDEWDDQMDRLLDGKVPDLVDLTRQATMNGKG